MNLAEWIGMDNATRDNVVAECYRRGTPREIGELAEQAAKMLTTVLEKEALVTSVEIGEDYVAKRLRLLVSTLLCEGEKLAAIPKEFAGFPVLQFGVADRKRDFLSRMEFVLRSIGFPSAEWTALLQRIDRNLNRIGSPYYVETPGRWIAEVLIATPASGHLNGLHLVALRADLCDAINDFFKGADPVKIGFDALAMARLRSVLRASYGKHGVVFQMPS